VLKHIRQNSLTSLRYSAAHRGGKNQTPANPYGGQLVARHTKADRQNNSTPVHWGLQLSVFSPLGLVSSILQMEQTCPNSRKLNFQ
jgi:hypothetical protein